MLSFTNNEAEIAVIGRCGFQSGIGAMSYAACEMISRHFPVCILPTEPHLRDSRSVTLPNGREIPVCKDASKIKISFFCDVLWNGVSDFNYNLVPEKSLKYAWLVYDSDLLPPRWTELLNEHFNLIVATSPHLIDVARNSGVTSPIACMPIPLDIESLLAQPVPLRDKQRIRFGSVAAFHPRKGVLTLVESFIKNFADRSDAELVLHSNLAFGDTFDQVIELSKKASNIQASYGQLSEGDKDKFIRSFDVFVNASRGEGYSIGAREALAFGKALVLSDVGGHRDLAGRPGVILVKADLIVPGRYPEIDNGVFGTQRAVTEEALSGALKDAFIYAKSQEYDEGVYTRRESAREFSFGALSAPFAALFNPDILNFRKIRAPPCVSFPPPFVQSVQQRLGRRASSLSGDRHQICTIHDGGFFSIFNAFMSHLVWQQREERCHAVYPDWDVDRFLARTGDRRIMSFCYGRPGDGNIWLSLFEPLFGATALEMNDPNFLYSNACEPQNRHNEDREPNMTYVHAYRLYRTPQFSAWRRQYNAIFRQHVRLRAELRHEIEAFEARHLTRPFMVAAHIRHPSHTVEQPGSIIAHVDSYIEGVYRTIGTHGFDPSGKEWGVFLATDQEHVVRRFKSEFGERVAFHKSVRRTRSDEDVKFNSLSAEEKNQEGHQLQHLVAANRAHWSTSMAWEVVRDAYCMAKCNALLHVVSNVSTAISYMNPDIEMIFCEAV